jgi:amino acid adenylation domain-containing protein
MSDPATTLDGLDPLERRALLARLISQEEHTYPVSYAQERLWFLDQLSPGTASFNMPHAIRFDFPIDLGALERAINEIVRRHAMLRTTFTADDGLPRQVVHAELKVGLNVVDLSGLPTSRREEELQRLANEETQRPFDLASGPLLRTTIWRTGPTASVFLLILHHIVSDGWSLGVFFEELGALYQAFVAGRPSPLPPLSIQYHDFSVWQREHLSGHELEAQLAYWKTQLTGLEAVQLPTDRPRPTFPTFRGALSELRISPSVVNRLTDLTRAERATLFMTLLAAFQVLLHRYTRQDDIAVGTYIANRTRAETERLIGFFVNTLVMRANLSAAPSFREQLRRTKAVAVAAYAHQDVPFPRLVQELQPDRDPSRNPLFQVAFQLFNAPVTAAHAARGAVNVFELPLQHAVFDLVLHLWPDSGGLRGHLEYSTDLFDAATVQRIARQYGMLLESIATNPDQEIGALSLMSPSERWNVVERWNNTGRRYDWQRDVVDRFREHVNRHTDSPALLDGERRVTYRELDERSNAIANAVLEAGAGPEIPVAVCLERSIDANAALMGVFKAGAAWVPLDASYPRARLQRMLDDSGARILIARPDCQVAAAGGRTVTLPCTGIFNASISAPPRSPLKPDQLAYIVFTSGSTGVPKGIVVEHRVILNRLAWMAETAPFDAGEVACQRTALSFVDSLWEMLGPLLSGIPAVIVPDETPGDVDALLSLLGANSVTRMWTVPTLLRGILAAPDIAGRVPTLRFWVATGEPLPPDLLAQFYERLPDRTLYNLYGTSEVWDATWYDTRPARRPLIGRPIANVQAYVLDPKGQPCGVGVPGELWIGGAGLARGYLHLPDLTSERFRRNPFRSDANAWIYRTGDEARFLEDGNLEHLGRRDQQCKVRGHRVDLREIEAVLVDHPAVAQAAVLLKQDSHGEGVLHAFIVMADSHRASHEELTSWLGLRVPAVMMPSAFLALESLPVLPNGKVDRSALAAMDGTRIQLDRKFVAPRSDMERTIADLWAELLKLERVGIHDNFFADLGGHSLLATRFVSRLRQRTGLDLGLRRFFEAPTVAELALIADSMAGSTSAPPAIVRQPRKLARVDADGEALTFRDGA